MHLGLGLKNMTLQLVPSVGRACALASAMADYGGIKLLPVGVHQEDRCGGGTSYAKASPLFPKTHRRCCNSVSTQAHTSKRSLRGKGLLSETWS